jgi:hypothetical protein
MRKFSILLASLVTLLAVPAEVLAQSAGIFARMGFGARGMAMSNALVADVSGDASPYYNPALAPLTASQSIEASAALLTFDRELQFLQFATPMKPRAGIAAGLIHAGVSKIDGRDNSGYHTGNFSTDEYAFFLAFGIRMGSRVTGGIGLQLFRADLFEGLKPASSLGLDLGVTVKATEALHLGLAVDDLLARYTWDSSALYGAGGKTTSDQFPTRFRVGGSYRMLDGRVLIVGEYESIVASREHRMREVEVVGDVPREVMRSQRLRLHDSRMRVGGEYRPAELFAIRAGLDRIGAGEVAGASPSAGFMVEQGVGSLGLRGEYAFVLEPYGHGGVHLVSLRITL